MVVWAFLALTRTFNLAEIPLLNQQESLEEKPEQIFIINCSSTNLWDLIHRYSSINRLLRITVLCTRIISRFKGSRTILLTNPITTQELENAKFYWVKEIQKYAFHQKIKLLSAKQQLPRSNPLVRLTPWIDSQGLVRVGGRLQSALLSTASKHPLILPRNSALTSLIISNAHIKMLHGGTQLTFVNSKRVLDHWWASSYSIFYFKVHQMC